jgi:phosphoserine phosphatase RsbU/P
MDYRELFHKLERHLGEIEAQSSLKQTLGLIIENLLRDLSAELGLTGARLYVLDDNGYRLEAKYGARTTAPIGFTIPAEYPPLVTLARKGVIFADLQAEGVDPRIERQLGVERFAAIAVGPGNAYVIAFSITEERKKDNELTLFGLSALRHTINLKLAKENLESIVLQSQEIQLSLLPEKDPVFPGFDIAGKSIPAEVVGGDIYDFLEVNPNIIGLAIGDATGHGLPAALQARDVLTGLRMGIREDQKMVKTLEKLNRVIHRSRLTSRYVSLFYGELEVTGHLIYCNAGLNRPYYFRAKKKRFYPLAEGGMVLGPTSDATYQRGFYRLEPGDLLVCYTDGITEASNLRDEEFGEERVKEFILENHEGMASKELVEGLLGRAADWSRGSTLVDDRTALIVKRLA